MTSDEFSALYDVLHESVPSDDVGTRRVRHRATGRIVMAHDLSAFAPPGARALRARLATAAARARARVVALLDVDGRPVAITELLPDGVSLGEWLDTRLEASPATGGSPAPIPSPVSSRAAPPTEAGAPAPEPARAAATSAGEFTRAFASPTAHNTPRTPDAPPPAAPPPPRSDAPQATVGFTQIFTPLAGAGPAPNDSPPTRPPDLRAAASAPVTPTVTIPSLTVPGADSALRPHSASAGTRGDAPELPPRAARTPEPPPAPPARPGEFTSIFNAGLQGHVSTPEPITPPMIGPPAEWGVGPRATPAHDPLGVLGRESGALPTPRSGVISGSRRDSRGTATGAMSDIAPPAHVPAPVPSHPPELHPRGGPPMPVAASRASGPSEFTKVVSAVDRTPLAPRHTPPPMPGAGLPPVPPAQVALPGGRSLRPLMAVLALLVLLALAVVLVFAFSR